MRTSRFFSLLEVMVGLALIMMAAAAIGWKIHDFVEKKRFVTDLERLRSRIITIHRIAVNMQSDWEGIIEKEGKSWIFRALSLDSPKPPNYPPIKLSISEPFFEGEPKEVFRFIFYSSGEIWPRGALKFRRIKDLETVEWNLPSIFGILGADGGKALGPHHPDEA